MSGVNFLDKLLGGVAVGWKPLGDVCRIETGKLNANAAVEDGPFMFFTTAKEISRINKYRWDTEALLIAGNANVGEVKHYTGKFEAYQRTYVLTNFCKNVSVRYLYYVIAHGFKKYLEEKTNSAAMTYIVLSTVENFPIPIPCPDNPQKSLEIQAEIVRILDAFTAMTAELTAELNLRKKQYNYYRDQLLSFEEGEVEWKTLGEISLIQRGASPRPIAKYITEDEDGVPWVKIGDTSPGSKYVRRTAQKVTLEGAKKSRILNVGDFIMSNSMSFGRPYIMGIKGAIHDGWASISGFNETLSSDYLYHYLSSNTVQNYWAGKINSGSVSNLNADIIKTLPVPIPEISKQEEVAAILDKFDALTNSITEGLPREIELRQKQYEYYRDLLLSFPKPDAEEVA